MTPAEKFNHRILLQKRAGQPSDAQGISSGDWGSNMELWAAFRPVYGREQVQAGAMESTFRGVLTIRERPETLAISGEWRATFLNGPNVNRVVNILSVIRMSGQIELVVEGGVAT